MTSEDRSRLPHTALGDENLSMRQPRRRVRCRTRAALLVLATGVVAFTSVHAADAPSPALAALVRSLARAPYYEEAQISPDARHVAWVQRLPDDELREIGSAVFLAPAQGREAAIPIGTAGRSGAKPGISERDIAWSPDSRALAFLSDAGSAGQMQLYLFRLGDAAPRRLTQLEGTLAAPRFSPDGTQIALLFTAHADRGAGPLVAVPAPTGVIGERVLEQSLVLIDVRTGALRQLSAPDRYVYEYDWSPRGDALVATAAHGSGDDHWYTAQLVVFHLPEGTEQVLLEPSMQIAAPRWSPDARSIAFLGGLMSDESVAAGDLYVLPSAGG
ncbi:MAG: PD40 domain-containing protein, partial [Gammaproteobacteria bacterium]|nr:PD40 domain-containing protein [Gammaproteobacteria bacterium]